MIRGSRICGPVAPTFHRADAARRVGPVGAAPTLLSTQVLAPVGTVSGTIPRNFNAHVSANACTASCGRANAPDFGPTPLPLCVTCAEEWCASATSTGLTVVLVGPVPPPVTPDAVDAALTCLANGKLPAEPKGADLTWRAIERERGYDRLSRDYPDAGDGWKDGGQ